MLTSMAIECRCAVLRTLFGFADGAVACNVHTFKIESEPMHELYQMRAQHRSPHLKSFGLHNR